tara:strand:+ start:409 stop:720 length:312 start_codon:yes stop_codon:yes gene_type:complete
MCYSDISPFGSKNKTPELYNLQDDIGERNNLALKFPEKTQALLDIVNKHYKHVQSALYPTAIADDPRSLLKDASGLPTLAEYMIYRTYFSTVRSINKNLSPKY